MALRARAAAVERLRGYRRDLSEIGVLNAKNEVEARNRLMDRLGESPN